MKKTLCLALLCLISCSNFPVSTQDISSEAFKEAKSRIFKKKEREKVENWAEFNDKAVSAYITRIGKKVLRFSKINSLNFVVIDTELVQGVSSSGKESIYLTRGMLYSMQNEAELACLLGHEISHQEHYLAGDSFEDHEINPLKKKVLESAGAGEDDIADIAYSDYSKEKETKADEEGSILCNKVGYYAYGLSDLLERLAEQTDNGLLVRIRKIKGSHRGLKERAEHLRKFLSEKGIKETGLKNEKEFVKNLSSIVPKEIVLTNEQQKTLTELNDYKNEVQTHLNKTGPKLTFKRVWEIIEAVSQIIRDNKIGYKDFITADTFRSGTYAEMKVNKPIKLYRVYGDETDRIGNFWSRTKPEGPLQASLDAALDPSWGNTAQKWVEITIPGNGKTTIFEGAAARVGNRLGGGNQIYINKEIPEQWISGKGNF